MLQPVWHQGLLLGPRVLSTMPPVRGYLQRGPERPLGRPGGRLEAGDMFTTPAHRLPVPHRGSTPGPDFLQIGEEIAGWSGL